MALRSLSNLWHLGIVGISLILFWSILGLPIVFATLYSCVSSTGTTIYTDSPAQLRDCTPLSLDHPDSTSSPRDRSQGRIPDPVRQENVPNTSSNDQQDLPSVKKKLPAQRNEIPAQSIPSPATSPCVSPVNPLNPLLNRPCQKNQESPSD